MCPNDTHQSQDKPAIQDLLTGKIYILSLLTAKKNCLQQTFLMLLLLFVLHSLAQSNGLALQTCYTNPMELSTKMFHQQVNHGTGHFQCHDKSTRYQYPSHMSIQNCLSREVAWFAHGSQVFDPEATGYWDTCMGTSDAHRTAVFGLCVRVNARGLSGIHYEQHLWLCGNALLGRQGC